MSKIDADTASVVSGQSKKEETTNHNVVLLSSASSTTSHQTNGNKKGDETTPLQHVTSHDHVNNLILKTASKSSANGNNNKSVFEAGFEKFNNGIEREGSNHGGWRERHRSGKFDKEEIKRRHSQRMSAKNIHATGTTPTHASSTTSPANATSSVAVNVNPTPTNAKKQGEHARPQLEILPDGDLGTRIVVAGKGDAPRVVEVFGGGEDEETAFIEAADVQQIEIELAAENGARGLNIDLSQEYQKPNIDRALEYRRRHTPHKKNGDPFGVWSARTGRYIPKKLQCLDPFHEGRKSDFAVYGPGISNYFKYQKWLGSVMFIMLLLQIPTLVIFIKGGNYFTKYGFPFAQTTIGNLFIDINTSVVVNSALNNNLDLSNYVYTVTVPGFCAKGAYGCAFSRDSVLELVSLLDVIACVVFLLLLSYAELFSGLEMKLYRNKVPKIEDYTIQVVSIPSGADDRSLAEHFEDVVGAEVYDVQIVESTGHAIQLCVLRGKLLKKAARMDARIKVYQKGGASDEVIEKLKEKFEKLQKKIDEVDEKAKKRSEKGNALMAYVTFESKAAYNRCLKMYDVLWVCGKQPSHLRFRGPDKESDMVIRPAPSPSTLLWENNEYSRANKFMRSALALFGLFTILLFSVLVSYFSDQYKALAQVTQFTGSTNKLCDGQYDSLSIQVGAIQAKKDGNLQCFCDYHFFQVALDETTDDFLFVKGGLCDQFYNTRAGDFAIQMGISFLIVVLNIIIYRFVINASEFQKFVSVNDREIHVLTSIFFVTFINTALITLLVNIDWNSFLGTNINIDVQVNEQVVSILKSGAFTDFEPTWYSKVGVEVFIIGILNIFGPHVYPMMVLMYTMIRRRFSTPISQQELNELYLGVEFVLSVRHAQSLMMVFYIFMYSSGMPIMYLVGVVSAFTAYWVDKVFFTKLSRTPPQYTCDLADWATSTMRFAIVLHCLIGAWMYSSPKTFPKTAQDLKEGILDELLKDNQINVNDYKNALPQTSDPFVKTMIARLTLPEALLPLLLAAVIVAWKILRRFSFFIRIGQNIFHFFLKTFRTCMHSTFADIIVNDVDIPFSKALEDDKLVGLQSYNILANPTYQEALQFQPEFGEDGADNIAGFHSLADALQFGKNAPAASSKMSVNMNDIKSSDNNHTSKARSVVSDSSSSKKDDSNSGQDVVTPIVKPKSVVAAEDGDNKSVASSKAGKSVLSGNGVGDDSRSEVSGMSKATTQLRKGREWESRSRTRSKPKTPGKNDDSVSVAPSNAS